MSRTEAIVRLSGGVLLGLMFGLLFRLTTGTVRETLFNVSSTIISIVIIFQLLSLSRRIRIAGFTLFGLLLLLFLGLLLAGFWREIIAISQTVVKPALVRTAAYLGESLIAWMIGGATISFLFGMMRESDEA